MKQIKITRRKRRAGDNDEEDTPFWAAALGYRRPGPQERRQDQETGDRK